MKTTVFAIHECPKANQHTPIKVVKILGPFGVKWNLHVDVQGGMMVGIDYCPYCAMLLQEQVKAIPSQA